MRFDKESEIWRALNRETITLEDVKLLFRHTRNREDDPERIAYANSLLPEAGEYLRAYELRALLRADISETEAAVGLAANKAFFSRLVGLLPSILSFFEHRQNLAGILWCIDECHNNFHHAATSPRRDRQARQTKALLTVACEATATAAAALEDTKRLIEIEYDRYREVYYPNREGRGERPRFLEKLIEELGMSSGVLEIMSAKVDLSPKRDPFTLLHLSGNDQRTLVVESAYHMSTDWNGPKLVTTPGSRFATLCSLLFEAVSGNADESLSGAINRYARSDDRRLWDIEGEELEDEDDNFLIEKQKMKACTRQIQLCKALQKNAPGLSSTAKTLLQMRIDWEQQNYKEASETYGPRQVYIDNYNSEQLYKLIAPLIEQIDSKELEELCAEGLSTDDLCSIAFEALTGSDVSVGKARRSGHGKDFDT
jgi:hypothetical protein